MTEPNDSCTRWWARIFYLRMCRAMPETRNYIQALIDHVDPGQLPRLLVMDVPWNLKKLVEKRLKKL
jgi:hypothetical protein